MRHQPCGVDRIAGEPTADLVVDPAPRHGVEGRPQHEGGSTRPGKPEDPEQELEDRLLGELGCRSEPTVCGVEAGGDRLIRRLECRQTGSLVGRRRPSGDRPGELAGLADDLGATLLPSLLDGGEDPAERGHPVAVLGREVGAGVERLSVGGEEHSHRPAAPPGQRLHRLHVDGVDVGPLLAVDLDVDEGAVHLGCRRLVLERLVGHHVAPVARGVAHAEQDRDLTAARRGERLIAPLVPVDRVGGMLAEVGRARLAQSVAHPDTVAPTCRQIWCAHVHTPLRFLCHRLPHRGRL